MVTIRYFSIVSHLSKCKPTIKWPYTFAVQYIEHTHVLVKYEFQQAVCPFVILFFGQMDSHMLSLSRERKHQKKKGFMMLLCFIPSFE